MLRAAFRVSDKRLFARFVAWWLSSDVSHCELSGEWAGDDHFCVGSSWLDGGVRGKLIKLTPDKWRVYEIDGDPQALRDWLKVHDGLAYDWLGLLGFGLRPIRGFTRRMFCSEANAEALGLSEPWRYDPAAFECIVAHMGRRIQ